MAPTARTTPPRAQAQLARPFATLGEIAERLAGADAPNDVIPGILELTRETLAARECVVWLLTPQGMVRAWGVGDLETPPEEIADLLATDGKPGGKLAFTKLVAGRKRLGVLLALVGRELTPDERAMFNGVGNILAPQLARSEESRQLSAEVEMRARQFDEQRKFIGKIIDSLPLGLYVIDREYRIQAWNRKRETGTQGVSREEAVGRTIFEILHRQPAELLRREFDDVFATGRIQQFQTESTASGDLRTYRISKIPMRIGDSAVTHVITIGEDVTEWKEAQERISQAEKLAAIGQLAAGVMHEINNPLATIAACAESLGLRLDDLRGAGVTVPPEGDEYLKLIDNEVHRCKKIVDGLLDFSRPKPVTHEPVDVNAVIEQTLFLLKHHARFKRLNIITEYDPELGRPVRGNTEQLIQVFMALLLNAMDAMGERGTITIKTRRGGSRAEAAVAEVSDEGHGIARSELPKIFEPFYTTKAPGRGTGLGLSICYGIVAEHGGRIEVDSAPGKGSTFRVILPAGDGEGM